jgi:hypothetical protein
MQQCGKVFNKIKALQEHLGMHSVQAAAHVWLPKHRMYLKGERVGLVWRKRLLFGGF